MGYKGSWIRRRQVSHKTWCDNWEMALGKKQDKTAQESHDKDEVGDAKEAAEPAVEDEEGAGEEEDD